MAAPAIDAAGSAATPHPADREQIRNAARGLEAVLMRELVSAMEKAQLEDGFFSQQGGFGAHQTTFALFLSEAMAEREPLGLADQISRQLDHGQRSAAAGAPGSPDSPVSPRPHPISFDTDRNGTQVLHRLADERGGQPLPRTASGSRDMEDDR